MVATVTNISNLNIAGNQAIDGNEGTTTFDITGTSAYTSLPNEKYKTGDQIAVTVTWTDGIKVFEQQLFAVVTSGNNVNPIAWKITEDNIASHLTFVPNKVTISFDNTSVTSFQSITSNVCFLRGTRVLTRHGYCPVEELAVGDEVRTLSGDWQPLRWIGHQPVITPFGLAKSAPVRITAGAFGPALPERDVCVSPDHAIFFRNQLIPAKFLVNGVTVFRDTNIKEIEYFHLLLDRHAVIFSEGLATESYVPCENIDWFDNTAECPQALLNAIRAGTAECLIECYPRKTTGPAVEAARALLARFAPADAKDRAVG
jgi:hypothetical protein